MADAGDSARDESPALPPFDPSKTPGPSLMDQLASMGAGAAASMDAIAAESQHLNKKVTRVRRKSRDLEIEALGIEIKDRDNLQQIFDEIDVSKDGNIDRKEFKDALIKAGRKLTDEKMEEVFKSIDADGNGLLDFKELCKAFMITEA